MNRLLTATGLLVAFACMTPLAQAQQRGVTTSQLASDLAQLRQQNATLGLDMQRLEEQVASLNGEIETLEFLLSQSRNEMNRQQEDDSRIGTAIETLTEQNDRLTERVNSLESDVASLLDIIESGQEDMASGDESTSRNTGASNEGGNEPRRVTSAPSVDDLTMEGGANPAYQGSLGTLQASDLPGEAGPLFAEAKSRLLQFNFEGAEMAFRSFLEQFGDDPQAGEAQYWLAESLFQQEAYAESGQAYTQMIRQYPDDSRVPDALVKLARSMRLLGDDEKACQALNILDEQYPGLPDVKRRIADQQRTLAGCGA